MAVPVIQGVAGVVIALFLLRVLQGLTATSSNPIVQGINGGVTALIH